MKLNDPMPRVRACVRDGIPRCPYCLSQMESAPDIPRDDRYYDCPSCSIRVKIWSYSAGSDWLFLRHYNGNKTFQRKVKK